MLLSTPTKLLILLCAFHFIVNWVWLSLNTHPLPWDQAGHTKIAIEYSRYMTGTLEKQVNFLQISSYYPPFVHIVTAALMVLFGTTVFVGGFVSTASFLALIIGTYLLGKQLTGDEWISLVSATIISLLPPIYENSRWLLLDIPLLAALVYSWYFLDKSESFKNNKFTILFGLSCAAVLLIKWVGVVFLIIPALLALIRGVREGLIANNINVLYLSFLLILFITFPWYFSNVARIIEIASFTSQGEITDPQHFLSFENIVFYFSHILNFQFTLWPALCALFSAAYYLHKPNKYRLLILLNLVVLYIFFSFISNKDIRYTLPLLLPLSYMYAHTLVSFIRKRIYLPSIVLSLCVVWLFIQHLFLSFGLLPFYQRAFDFGPLGWIDYINTGDIVVSYPKQDNTANQQIIDAITREQSGISTSVLVGVDQPALNPSTLDLLLILQNNRILNLQAPYTTTNFSNEDETAQYVEFFPYVLVPTGEVSVDATRHRQALEQIRSYVMKNQSRFEVIATYDSNSPANQIMILKKK